MDKGLTGHASKPPRNLIEGGQLAEGNKAIQFSMGYEGPTTKEEEKKTMCHLLIGDIVPL